MLDPLSLLTGILCGLLAGLALVWLAALGPLRREASAARHQAAEAEARTAAALARAEESARLQAENADLREQLQERTAEAAGLRAERDADRRQHTARLEDLAKGEERLRTQFRTLAEDVLGENAKRFLALVSERFDKHSQGASEDLERRRAAVEGLVKPISDKLERFNTQIGEIERRREGAYRAIEEQVRALQRGNEALSGETRRLVQALRAPKARGRWGELQLRQVFEMAGMVEHVDYVQERSVEGENGLLRPDAVVRMPGAKSIVIDAKTPLDAYLRLIETSDPEAQKDALVAHARQLRTQMQGLSKKEYWARLDGSPDFVVMFIPGEAIYSAAMQTDPSLFEDAFRNRVLIATPTTLIALVKAIAYGWTQERLAENAREIRDTAVSLYERLGKFGEHFGEMGKSLRQSVERYNRAVGSLEGRVLPAARKLEGLGVGTGEGALAAPGPVEQEPRALSAPELTERRQE
ncbi:MAG: DNA recombination protein RmuC [Pseudomonadota bacterium]